MRGFRALSLHFWRERSRRRRTLTTLTALSLLLCSSFSSKAEAFERQWHVGVSAGYSAFITPVGATLHGGGGGLHLTYGLSDTINMLVLADVTMHDGTTVLDEETGETKAIDAMLLAGGSAGVGYVFDILQWVPYVGALAGGYYVADTVAPGGRIALTVPFGLDYQVSRSFAIGAAGEYKLLFLDPAGVGQRFTAFLRAEYIWGY